MTRSLVSISNTLRTRQTKEVVAHRYILTCSGFQKLPVSIHPWLNSAKKDVVHSLVTFSEVTGVIVAMENVFLRATQLTLVG
jgi:hypothetical protein